MTSENNMIKTFSEFMDAVQSARQEQYVGKKGRKVANEVDFTNMKEHLSQLYQGVEVQHSFADENGSVFDCVPIEQQPGLKGSLSKAPDLPGVKGKTGPKENMIANHVQAQLITTRKDKFGNVMSCPAGTIPLRRITLDELTRFGTLRQFFQKSPVGSGRPPNMASPIATAATHRWAHAYENVDNIGGHSFLNVWDPSIVGDQIFSLSQHWYVGGSGSNLQTAEVGWQVYPGKYGSALPVFFIYWTADDYQNTGCYNLDCQAFVQTNNSWTIGGTIAPVSVTNGQQYEIELAFYLYQGNWWLYAGGTSSSNAIGYYPTSIYNNGAMESKASEIDYGGEVVGTTSWPPMGSGAFAGQGWQKAAYQRDIYYFPTAGGASSANLTASQTSPCFTATVIDYNPPWNETVWFGGPGGTTC
jgi:Neprosin/Neprosin activation peptide